LHVNFFSVCFRLLLYLIAPDYFIESVHISLPWGAASFQIAAVILVTPYCDNP
jgi:hypothetical protein